MQSLVDSLCRCFGSTPLNRHDLMEQLESLSLEQSTVTANQSQPPYGCGEPFRVKKQVTPPTPEMKRRTRSLQLQDKQWDALFFTSPTGAGNVIGSSPPSDPEPRTPRSSNNLNKTVASPRFSMPSQQDSSYADHVVSAVEQANAVAQAKKIAAAADANAGAGTAATPSNPRPSSPSHSLRKKVHKRKRSASGSRDDIFRSKKSPGSGRSHFLLGSEAKNSIAGCGGVAGIVGTTTVKNRATAATSNPSASNRFSRFLSTHPVIASTLCFATPVTDSSDEAESTEYEGRNGINNPYLEEATSVVSGDNTLNTAEDTITSTLYYETTKLAGLSQTSPPMPLFNSFCVDECDDIHRIISTHSHMTHKPSRPEPQQGLHQRQSKVFIGGAFSSQLNPRSAPSPLNQGPAQDRLSSSPLPNPTGRPASANAVDESPQSIIVSSSPTMYQVQPPLMQGPLEPLETQATGVLRPNRRPRLDEGVPPAVSSSDSSRSQA